MNIQTLAIEGVVYSYPVHRRCKNPSSLFFLKKGKQKEGKAKKKLRRNFHIEEIKKKEVIQPHLPVRLPCYDFTPVTSSALGVPLPFSRVGVTTLG
jgi:hypothetical protein